VIDPDAYAALLCDWCVEAEPGQQILVHTTTLAEPAAAAIYRALLDRGAWPLLRLEPPSAALDFYRHASEHQLDSHPPLDLLEHQSIDCRLHIEAPLNTRALNSVDPALAARVVRARQPVREARLARRWASSIWPTPALAQEAGMDDRDYEDFLERALYLDQADPVAAWRRLGERQAQLIERLRTGSQIRIENERSDLTLAVGGRSWQNSDGRRNMPSGEVFTGPHERSANGTIHFDIPSAHGGREVTGVTLTFRDGEVIAAHAERGEEALQAALNADSGARFLGELGIGTNTGIDRATGSTMLDEKIAGTVHLALGRSYPETGASNESTVHWDLICDLRPGGRVELDGETLIEDGVLK
jgi:aminopeptidase